MTVSGQKKAIFLLCLIIVAAFILRMWGVSFGLPGLFHFDERFFVYNAFYSLAHKGAIHTTYTYGNLIPYILGGLYSIYYVILKIIGAVRTPFDFLVLYMQDPSRIYLIGRMLTVLASAFSVLALYLVGAKLYNKTVGLISAFFLAFSFLPIHQAKFIKGDTLGTLFLLFAFYFIIAARKNEYEISNEENNKSGIKNYILVGVFAGLAVGARFSLYVGLLALILMCLFLSTRLRLKNLFVLLLTGVLTFLIVTPSLIIQLPDFMKEVSCQLKAQSIPWVTTNGWPVWLFYLTEHIRGGMGVPLEITALCGIIYLLFKLIKTFVKRNVTVTDKLETGLVLFVILFFVFALARSANFERYAVPVIPFFSLFAAVIVYKLIYGLKLNQPLKQLIVGLLCIGLVFPNLINAVKYDCLISCADTRNLAKDFIEKTVPEDAKITVEGLEGYEETSCLGVPLHKSKEQLKDFLLSVERNKISGNYVLAAIEGQKPPTYNLENVYLLETPFSRDTGMHREINFYVNNGTEYLITTSWLRDRTDEDAVPSWFLTPFSEEYELVKEFNPYPVFKWDHYCFRIDYKALSEIRILAKNNKAGPVIKIYKKKDKLSDEH